MNNPEGTRPSGSTQGQHATRGKAAFEAVTFSGGHEIASIYFYYVLDSLVDLAYAISFDFFKSPQLYTTLADERTAEAIARLHAELGTHRLLPSKAQREEIYDPLFGMAGGEGSTSGAGFPQLRDSLFAAAIAFAARTEFAVAEMLRARVRDALSPFQQYLQGLQGASVRWSGQRPLTEVNNNVAYLILTDPGVAARLGVRKPPPSDWPFILDPNGEKIVASITAMIANSTGRSNPPNFYNLQQAALRGADALAIIMDTSDTDSDSDIDITTNAVHLWRTSVVAVTPRTSTWP